MDKDKILNKIAPDGQVYVCDICGKRSHDQYGKQAIDHGWDVSCMLHAVLCRAEKNENDQWICVDDTTEKAC